MTFFLALVFFIFVMKKNPNTVYFPYLLHFDINGRMQDWIGKQWILARLTRGALFK